MTLGDLMAAGFRNAFILIGFACVFIGLVTRRSSGVNRGLGMALVVVGVFMVVFATLGRMRHWW